MKDLGSPQSPTPSTQPEEALEEQSINLYTKRKALSCEREWQSIPMLILLAMHAWKRPFD